MNISIGHQSTHEDHHSPHTHELTHPAHAVNASGLTERGSVASGSGSLGGLRRAAAQARERELFELEELESVDAAVAQQAIIASLEGPQWVGGAAAV